MTSMTAALTFLIGIVATSATNGNAPDDQIIQKRRQKNLKARRVNDEAEMMSIDTSVDSAEDPSQATIGDWFGLDTAPAPTGKACPSSASGNLGLPHGCAPKGKMCSGFSYYRLKTKNNPWPWYEAHDATPENCILASIGSEKELAEVYAHYRGLGSNLAGNKAWLGVRKSAFDTENDNGGSGSRANWFNLDGTPAAVCDESAWFNNQPNNQSGNKNGNAQYIAMKFDDGGLKDFKGDHDAVNDAIYKCCDEGITFTPASCGVATADE